jgi:hypothetical protein
MLISPLKALGVVFVLALPSVAQANCIRDGFDRGRTLGRAYCGYVRALADNRFSPTPMSATHFGVCDRAAVFVCRQALADAVSADSRCRSIWQRNQMFSGRRSARRIYNEFMRGCDQSFPE